MTVGQHRDHGDPMLRAAARVLAMHALSTRERYRARRATRPTSTGHHDVDLIAAMVVAALLLLVCMAVLISDHAQNKRPDPLGAPLVVTATWYPPGVVHSRHADTLDQLREVRATLALLCGPTPGFCPNPPAPADPAPPLSCPECARFGQLATVPLVILDR